jgi:hypothetical protein
MQWITSLLFPSLAMFCAEHPSEARGCASVDNSRPYGTTKSGSAPPANFFGIASL